MGKNDIYNFEGELIYPLGFCLTKYDWSQLEQESALTVNRLFVSVCLKLSDVFQFMINKKTPVLSQVPRDIIFSKTKGSVRENASGKGLTFKIYLKDFGVPTNCYKALRDFLKLIPALIVKIPEVNYP